MTDQLDREAVPPSSARRRYLTILFADLSDSARLAAAMEAEDYADLLARLRRAFDEVIPKHGGTIVQILGDGVLASFGYPEAREDDGRRATEAALDLHDLVRRLQPDFPLAAKHALRLHTGIHSGLVLLDEGDALSGRMRLFGNAVNIAARLSSAAETDQILVSQETLGAESHFFQTDAGHVVTLQGIADPVTALGIIGRAPVGTRFEARSKRGLTPFVGRRAELGTLMQNLNDTIAGKPRFVAMVAPAGLGKTRLAEEFLARAAALDCQIHRGYCESYLSAEPMQPFLQMLRTLGGLNYGMSAALAAEGLQETLLRIAPALIPGLPVLLRALSLSLPAPGEKGAARSAPENTASAMAKLFEALAAAKPVVLFIDDWQWADAATRQILGAIRGLDHCSILVLLATREPAPGDIGLRDAQIVNLIPFSGEEADRTIAQLLPGWNTFTVAEIRDYAGGNPLFVEELCHSAAHDHPDRRSGRALSGKAWLDKLIEARVERLPAPQIELVRTAAVIGNVIPIRVLESITGCGADHPLVLALAEQDLIYPGEQQGTLRFKHGIARDVIYESVGLRQRKAMHMQIAEALRQLVSSGLEEELYEPLAYHYAAGGQATEAARYAELAGDKAMAASALDRAQVQYLAALAAIDLIEPSASNYQRWMVIVHRLALASVFDPSWERVEVLLRAVDLAAAHDDRHARARAEYWVGSNLYALGESGQAIRHLDIALDCALCVDDAPLLTAIRATLGQACAAACDYDKAIMLLDEAVNVGHAHRSRSRPGMAFAYALACKASVLGDRGLFDEAEQCFDDALAGIRGAGHEVEGSILCLRSCVLLWQGRWDDARQCALDAQQVAERVKSLYLYAMSLSLGAHAAWTAYGSTASLQALADATSWLESRERGLFISLNHGWLAQGMAAAKQWQAARQHAARALSRGRRQDRIGEAMACRAMARASAAGQSRKPAQHYLTLAMDNALSRGSPHEMAVTQLCDAEIRAARGERAGTAALLDKAEAAFEAMKMAWHLGSARRLRRELETPRSSGWTLPI